jgi:hypothetical protein
MTARNKKRDTGFDLYRPYMATQQETSDSKLNNLNITLRMEDLHDHKPVQ